MDQKILSVSENKNEHEFQYEEFKDQIGLKQKILQDSLSNANQKTIQVEQKLKDHYNYMVRLKKQIQELQKERTDLGRLDVLEQKLSDDYIIKLVEMQVD